MPSNIKALYDSIPGVKKDWKADWKEDARPDWKFDWDNKAGGVPVPLNTVLPSLSGTVAAGQTLLVSTGTWIGDPTSFAYQWTADGVNLGADGFFDSNSVTMTPREVGKVIRVKVRATNAQGSTVAITEPTAPVAA